MILKLLGMIVLGLISAVLSYYDKNFYVRVFNDILGREEDENLAARVGRGFFYGFFFPVYFVLLLAALAALVVFVIVAGVVAGIVFVIVWITEKILPNESLGKLLLDLFAAVGIAKKKEDVPPSSCCGTGQSSSPCCSSGSKDDPAKPLT